MEQCIKNKNNSTSNHPSFLEIKIESIAFYYFVITAIKPMIIFLFFKKDAMFGTVVGSSFSLLFLFLLIPHLIQHGLPPIPFIWSVTAQRIGILLLFISVSLAWSQSSSRAVAIAYNIIYLADIFVIVLLMRLEDPAKVASSSLKGIILGAAIMALAVFGLTGLTVDNRLGDNEFLHPNTIGKNMGFALLGCYYMIMSERNRLIETLFWSGISALLLGALLLSLSKTSIVAFGAALMLVILVSPGARLKKSLVLAVTFMVFLSGFSRLENYIDQYLYNTQGGDALSTASGRVLIWAESWEMIKLRPLIGHGFLSFRDAGPQIASVRLVHAHNELIHLLFSYGLFGVLITTSIYYSFFRQLYFNRNEAITKNARSLGLGLLLFSLIQGLFTADVMGLVFPLPLLCMLTLWYANFYRSSERS